MHRERNQDHSHHPADDAGAGIADQAPERRREQQHAERDREHHGQHAGGDAGAAYYGRQVPADDVPKIRAALMLHYAENDEGVNAGIAAYEAALKHNGTRHTIHIYPGTQHAFNDDTAGPRYNKEAADLAWQRTLAFFKENLGAPPKAS